MTDLLLQIGLSNLLISLALALVAWAVHAYTKRPALAHLLWLLVLVKLVTPPVMTVPLVAIPGSPPTGVESLDGESKAGLIPSAIGALDRESLGAASEAESSFSSVSRWSTVVETAKRGLVLIWLLGSFSVLAWSLLRIYRFNRLLGTVSRVAPAELQRTASTIARRLRLESTPIIHTTTARLSPLVWWLGGKVRIVIPTALPPPIDSPEMQWIVAPALAHVRRRDHLVRWLEWLACVCFWWNPAVWWARRCLRANEEVCCDALVLSSLRPDPKIYANSLMTVLEFLASPLLRPPAMASEISSGGFLERRFKMIISKNSTFKTSRWLYACILLCAALILPLGLAHGQDYEKIAKRLGKAVKKGEITQEQSDIMMIALKKSVETSKKAKVDFDSMNREVKAALDAGKITKEEANAKWAAIRKKTAGKERSISVEDYRRIEAEIKKAVEAGKLSRKEAEAKLIATRKMIADDNRRERGGERRITVEEYRGIEVRVKMAVDEGRISAEEGEARLIGARKMVADDNRRERTPEEQRSIREEYRRVEVELKKAVEEGKCSEEDAKARLGRMRRRIADEGRRERGEERRITVEEYKRAEAELKKAVKEGKCSEEDAKTRLGEMRRMIGEQDEGERRDDGK